jgi:NAD(P)-dependent dehydrogenase (short-subunit alcohol dehydrogenase family)
MSPFLGDTSAPQHQSAETLGEALFQNESFEAWAQLYSINVSSIFFVTTALLGLLAAGGAERQLYPSCVINISSISGHTKLAQTHVRHIWIPFVSCPPKKKPVR